VTSSGPRRGIRSGTADGSAASVTDEMTIVARRAALPVPGLQSCVAPGSGNRTCADCGRSLLEAEAFELDPSGYTRCRQCVLIRTRRTGPAAPAETQACETLMPPLTTWSTSPPTESGWYRWRASSSTSMECVLVDTATGRVWRWGNQNPSSLTASAGGEVAMGGEWWPHRIDEPR
jgi:hypothetical protein